VGDNKKKSKDQKYRKQISCTKKKKRDEHRADALTLSDVVVLPNGQECRQCVETRQLNNSETNEDLA